MTLNQSAILISSNCSGKANSPSLHYMENTQFDRLETGKIKRMQNVYCFGQKTKMLLDALASLHLHYFSPDGTEFAVIEISEIDCKRVIAPRWHIINKSSIRIDPRRSSVQPLKKDAYAAS